MGAPVLPMTAKDFEREEEHVKASKPQCWVVRNSCGKGRGLFATRNIKINELIITEKPILVATSQSRMMWWAFLVILVGATWSLSEQRCLPWAGAAWITTVVSHISGAIGVERILCCRLICCVTVALITCAGMVCYGGFRLFLSVHSTLKSAQQKEEFFKLHSGMRIYIPILTELRIFRFNAVSDNAFGCICPVVSMVNHSCLSNACLSWHAETGCQQVHALRPIKHDEEITVSYIDLWQTAETRQRCLQRAMDFVCCCAACSKPANQRSISDSRRLFCQKVERRIPIKMARGEATVDLRLLRDTAREELGYHEHLIIQEMDRTLAETELRERSR